MSPAPATTSTQPRPPYQPLAGSLADRVCRYLRSHPQEELVRADFFRLFDVHGKSAEAFLDAPIAHGLLVKGTNEDNNVVWRAGPKLAELAASIPSIAQLGHSADGRAITVRKLQPRKELPPLDTSKIKLERGVPKPLPNRANRLAIYAPLIREMQPGTSRLLPTEHAQRFLDVAKKAALDLKQPQRWSIRKVDDTHSRVWRDA